MEVKSLSIPAKKPLLPAEDYSFLRKKGIEHIQKLCGKIWTDYNATDPGINILEVLCYAIADLGYRTSFDIKDILAEEKNNLADSNITLTPSEEKVNEGSPLFTAREILHCNPVSILDWRKVIIDTPGVKNAWVTQSDSIFLKVSNNTLSTATKEDTGSFSINGLYQVIVELEELADEESVKLAVKQKILQYRNLCEDFLDITVVQEYPISVCADLEVVREADIEKVLSQVYDKIADYFSPEIKFYSLEQLLQEGKRIEEIAEGPALEHGFIDSEELAASNLKSTFHTSDIINLILDIPEVIAVKEISYANKDGNTWKAMTEKWEFSVPDGKAPRLDVAQSKFIFYKGQLPYMANKDSVYSKYQVFRNLRKKYRTRLSLKDLPIPQGTSRNLSEYFPLQNDLPEAYGTGIYGIHGNADETRTVQAKQLKGYLLFFEQILANYLAQLANVKELFSFDPDCKSTYFYQPLQATQPSDTPDEMVNKIRDLKSLYQPFLPEEIQEMMESPDDYQTRKINFLDHLIARFSEDLVEYSLLMKSMLKEKAGEEMIRDKAALLNEYPTISAGRGKGFDYTQSSWDSQNVEGIKKRIVRILGFDSYERKKLASEQLKILQITNGKYKVCLFDENVDEQDEKDALLKSVDLEDEECAESLLLYIMSHGDNEEKYKMSADNKSFVLLNDCDKAEAIVFSNEYPDGTKAEESKQKIIDFFKEQSDVENFHIVEHILLRPSADMDLLPVCINSEENSPGEKDPYSFRISVILPSWPEKFRNLNFRTFVEQTIRIEIPSHIYARICWINQKQMKDFEAAYAIWLNEMKDPEKANKLINALFSLNNVYPAAILHSCADVDSDIPQVTLDNTTLGIF